MEISDSARRLADHLIVEICEALHCRPPEGSNLQRDLIATDIQKVIDFELERLAGTHSVGAGEN